MWAPNRQPYNNCHLLVINTQECEKSLERQAIFQSHKLWENMIQMHLGKQYELVAKQVMIGLHTAIYARAGFQHYCKEPLSTSLATGVGNIVGNKGAIGLCLKFGDTSLLFINAHLAGI